jgi:acylphosphatase
VSELRRIHVSIEGRVQGVFYRATCVERARALGLAGWVRNALDGRVEAEFEGEPAAVEAMLDWCREGPPHAHVEAVDVREDDPTGEQGFRPTR